MCCTKLGKTTPKNSTGGSCTQVPASGMVMRCLSCVVLASSRRWLHSETGTSVPFSNTKVGLGAVVEDQDQGAADAADHIGEEALIEARSHALLGCNLLEAVHST